MPDSRSLVIVGGGITGLAAAYQLTREGERDFLLVEAAGRLGGKIVTERTDGFVIEGGPDSFITFKPAALELCRELGLTDRLQGTRPDARGSFVKRHGRLHPLPAGLTGLVPSRLVPLMTTRTLSVAGRFRAGLELFIPRRRDGRDESVEEFTTRRFGREAYDWLVEPLLAGIHAADGTQLSVAATFPSLPEIERQHGGMLRAMLRRKQAAPTGAKGSAFMTPIDGAAEIVQAIARTLPAGSVRTTAPVRAIERREERYHVRVTDGSIVETGTVIVATPADVTSRLLSSMDPDLATLLAAIPFVSTATVSLGYRAADVPHALDGYGYLSPRTAGGPVVACNWASSKFAGRAPEGHVLLRVFVGRAGVDRVVHAGDDALAVVARDELRHTLGITAPPVMTRVYRWPDGIPEYSVGHLDRVNAIEERVARHPGLFVAGASYRGAGLPDCIEAGREAASRALDESTRLTR